MAAVQKCQGNDGNPLYQLAWIFFLNDLLFEWYLQFIICKEKVHSKDWDETSMTFQQSLENTGSYYIVFQPILNFKNIFGGCGSAKN